MPRVNVAELRFFQKISFEKITDEKSIMLKRQKMKVISPNFMPQLPISPSRRQPLLPVLPELSKILHLYISIPNFSMCIQLIYFIMQNNSKLYNLYCNRQQNNSKIKNLYRNRQQNSSTFKTLYRNHLQNNL